MRKEELIQQISATIGKKKVLELRATLRDNDFAIKDLIDLTFHPNQQIGFRASWILENLISEEPERILPALNYFIQKFPEVTNQSCKRHYTKILMQLTSPKVKDDLQKAMHWLNLEAVAEACFDWLIDPVTPIAVKAFCCEILYQLREHYTWINEELAEQVRFIMINGSAGIQSKGRKILSIITQPL